MVNVALLDATRTPIDEATCRLAWTEERRVTLRLPAAGADRLHVRFRVSFDRFVDPQRHGSVELRYALAYAANELADLFNSAGSDKGTEPGSGTHGVPHCYALAYEPLLGSLRNRAFSLLEIGLDDESKSIGDPTDAPSLRAWRAFFPKATLYGYDINDFSFVRQPGLVTFQGDQSSREDLGRFLATYRDVTFAVVVDDGSHASADQQISLAALFHRVDPGGLYIVEDLNWQPRRESPTTLEALRAFEADGVFASPFITASEAEYLQEAIDGIEILRPNDSDCAVIRKKQLLAT